MRNHLPLTFCIGGLALALFASLLAANPGVVKTRAGQVYNGEIAVDDDGNVTVTVRGVATRISRTDVASIDYYESIPERYKQQKAALQPRDVEGRLKLASFVLDAKFYDLAEEVLQDALKIEPTNERAKTMLETVRLQKQLDAEHNAQPPVTPTTNETVKPVERRFLSNDDIQDIRQRELKSSDAVRVQIPADLKRTFAEKTQMEFAEFNRKSPVEQAMMVITKGDDADRRKVKILTDPEAISTFRRVVQPRILSGCATAGCHGPPSKSAFILFSPADTEAAAYTNFYILSKYARQVGQGDGIFDGPAMRKMIDRGNPENSLAAGFGLPPASTMMPHPRMPNPNTQYNGIYRNRDDPNYKRLIEWIGKDLNQIEPEYSITYAIPGMKRPEPSTKPASQPAK